MFYMMPKDQDFEFVKIGIEYLNLNAMKSGYVPVRMEMLRSRWVASAEGDLSVGKCGLTMKMLAFTTKQGITNTTICG